MHRLVSVTLATIGIAVGAMLAPTSGHAAADCSEIQAITNTFYQGQLTTFWDATCNTKWNATVVVQYYDANGWHNDVCMAGLDCKRDKPNDGGWFYADTRHFSNDTWTIYTPANPCTHLTRLRVNIHFQNGAGGITLNGQSSYPC